MPTPKKQTTAVAKAENKSTEIAHTGVMPEFMQQYAGQGTENIGADDVEIPRLILLQSLSPEVTEGDEKAGGFYHNVLEKNLGDELEIVPIYCDIQFILWNPRHEGGGILARARDGKHWTPSEGEFDVKPSKDSKERVKWKLKPTVAESGLAEWGSSIPSDENSQPAATKMWNVVCVLPEYPEYGPMVLTFQRGTADVGKKFFGKLKGEQAPSYGQVYKMVSRKEDKGSGEYFSMSLTRVGFVTDVDQFNHNRSMYEAFKAKGLDIKDLEGAQDDAGPASPVEKPEGAIDV